VDRDGHVLGALCGTDVRPRAWSPEQVAQLTTRADSAVRRQLAVDAADLGSYDLLSGELTWDARMLALHVGAQDAFSRSVDADNAVVHPDDLDGVHRRRR
jgi:hypothetical protein